jgi:parallel beta-helix repeat protein
MRVFDACEWWCGTVGDGSCHSHGPLFDNIAVRAYSGVDTMIVTNTNQSGPGSLYDAWALAYPISTPSVILFDIPGPGPHVIQDSIGIHTLGPLTIDGRSQPGYAGTPLIIIEGPYWSGKFNWGIRLSADCEVYALGIRQYSNGIAAYGNNIIIDGCEISEAYGFPTGYPYGFGIDIGGGDGLVQNCEIHDCLVGIAVPGSSGNTFRANRIYDNSRMGIDLPWSPDAVDSNDPLDADTGGNDLQNYPVLDYYVPGAPGAIGGTLDTEPWETCVIEFYANSACHTTGHGEGEVYLGSKTVTTGASGHAAFHADLPSVAPGMYFTATATNSRGSTSEFSACCSVAASVFTVTRTSFGLVGGLEWAVDQANLNQDISTIRFNIPGPGPHWIRQTHILHLDTPIIIDGFSQPGASPNTNPPGEPDNAVIMIELDGGPFSATTAFQVGFGGPSVIRGLSIYDYANSAIKMVSSQAANSRVEGCRIGTHADGLTTDRVAWGVTSDAPGTVIGGSTPDTRNIIGPCIFDGVEIEGGSDQKVWNNYIGVAADGVTPLAINRNGVALNPGASTGVEIGGLHPGKRNVIANAAGDGVYLWSSLSVERIPILGNSIYNNNGLGIDLRGDGVTYNDVGDADNGPNRLQNFPVVLSVDPSGTGTRIQGSLNSTLNEDFRLEFFSNGNCDGTDYGEGETYLGGDSVETDPGPLVAFDFTLPVVVPGGVWITATATDSQGNTSEFSQCFEVINTETGTSVVVDPPDENGETPMTLTFDQVDTEGNTSLSSSGTCSSLPGSFELSDPPVCYEVTTDASYTGMIEVCVQYDEDALVGDEADVVIMHYDAGIPGWVDITTSVDTVLNIACGDVAALSPFAVGTAIATGVGEEPAAPISWALHQNVPNPFNPATTIRYSIDEDSRVHLAIYDVAGRLVRTLVDEKQRASAYTITWEGVNNSGQTVATGIYFYRITAGQFTQTRKMLLLK